MLVFTRSTHLWELTTVSDFERRKVARREGTFPVTIAVPGPVPLEGQTLNFSANGVLVIAHGKIPVFLGIQGKHYRGVLSRAASVDTDTTAFVIELLDPLEI